MTYRFATHNADGRVCCGWNGELAKMPRCERCRTKPISTASMQASIPAQKASTHPAACRCAKCASKHLTSEQKVQLVLGASNPPRVTFEQSNAQIRPTTKAVTSRTVSPDDARIMAAKRGRDTRQLPDRHVPVTSFTPPTPPPAMNPPHATFAQQNALVCAAAGRDEVLNDDTRAAIRTAAQGTPSVAALNAIIRQGVSRARA